MMSKTGGEILELIIKNQIKRDNLKKAKIELLHIHNMRMNKVISLQNKLKLERDIAFRELAYEIKQDFDKIERKKVSHSNTFSKPGPLNLTGHNKFY